MWYDPYDIILLEIYKKAPIKPLLSYKDIFFWKALQRPMDFPYDKSK